jgi:photosystem II stability/assembly factor-like uncharacterized protein
VSHQGPAAFTPAGKLGSHEVILLHEGPTVIDPAAAAEALIEEARQRQRKRRLIVATAVLVVAVASGVWASSNGGSTAKPPPSTARKPGHTRSPSTPSTTPKLATAPGVPSTYPVAISFSNAEHGLLLLQGCSGSVCTSLVEVTTDGGKNWKRRPAFLAYPTTASTHVLGVDALVFGSVRDGWAYGPGLFVTHDGGSHFHRVKVSAPVLAVAAVAGHVWVLEQRCSRNACGHTVLLTGPASGDALRPVADPPGFRLEPGYLQGAQFPLAIGGAEPHLVVLGGVFGLDVTTNGGRTWRQSRYPCQRAYVNSGWTPGLIALDPSGSLWLVCAGEPGTGYQSKQLWRSFDGGQSWLGPYRLSAGGYADTVDAVSSTAAWTYGARAPIFHSTDGGHNWKPMLVDNNGVTDGPAGFSAVGPDDAWIIERQAIGTSIPPELLRTTDGGRTWSSVQVRA